jgi:hypothetical protein
MHIPIIGLALVVLGQASQPTTQQVSQGALSPSQYVTWGIAIICSGLVGAIITATVASYRNRKQPIGYEIDRQALFTRVPGGSALKAMLSIETNQTLYRYENLGLVHLKIINKGNKDFPSFRFSVELGERNPAIYAEPSGIDRNHVLAVVPSPSPDTPARMFDVTATPFNRGELYEVRLYVEMSADQKSPDPISVSTPEVGVVMVPVREIFDLSAVFVDALAAQGYPYIRIARRVSTRWTDFWLSLEKQR